MQQNKNIFPTDYSLIISRIESIDPIKYGRTRNNLGGDVTRISPYLTHGVVSLPQVRDIVLKKYSKKDSYTFIFELAWREFFQRVYQEEGNNIFNDLKSSQLGVINYGIPKAIIDTNTSINAIDFAYKDLYETGYMHNHARMWSAMLVTNLSRYEWWDVSRHMFYYLLDGDLASNTLSWQWVAGTFSSKQYVANQEMINKFTEQKQYDTYLSSEVSALLDNGVSELKESIPFELSTDFNLFKDTISLSDILEDNIMMYSIWTLDPKWAPNQDSLKSFRKILLIDKEELADFPMSDMRINFILELSKNIKDLNIVVASKAEIINWANINQKNIYRKNHPALYDWPGIVSEAEYLFPQISKVPRGFMSFWKKCEVYL